VDDLNSFESEKESTTSQSTAKPKPKAPLDEYTGKKNPYVTSIVSALKIGLTGTT
jgi:hypothetical protein